MTIQVLNNPLEGIENAIASYQDLSINISIVFVGSSSLGNVMAKVVEDNKVTLYANTGYSMTDIIGAIVKEVSHLVAADIGSTYITVRDHVWASLVPPTMHNLRNTSVLLNAAAPSKHLHS